MVEQETKTGSSKLEITDGTFRTEEQLLSAGFKPTSRRKTEWKEQNGKRVLRWEKGYGVCSFV